MSDFNITLFEACELLNRSKKSISRYIRRGLLHPQQIKSQQGTLEYRFSKADLEAFKLQDMKIYKTQSEVEADIKNGVLAIWGDVKFECPISINANIIITAGDITAGDITARNITACDINAWNINAGNITAWDITAGNITARNITACDINACDINAWDITAGDINARNINAWDINARDINARDISYYAFCSAYQSIKCTNIKSERPKAQEPICLDGQLEIKPKEDDDVAKAIQLLEEKGRLKDGKILS